MAEASEHPLVRLATGVVLHAREPVPEWQAGTLAALKVAVEKLPEGPVGSGVWAIKKAAGVLLEQAVQE